MSIRRSPSEPRQPPHTAAPGRLGCAALGALVLALYGRHLGTGYLADDFLFLEWAGQGPAELLRRVTGGVEPRFLRPLPAFLWYLGPSAIGAAVHHAVSLLAHALCGILVARIAGEHSRSREAGMIAGALFLAFPLFTEPVIWLAAGPDLWACCFALAALDLGLRSVKSERLRRDAGMPAITGAAALFAAGLLSKESVFMLPLLPLLLAPWRQVRRLCLTLSLVAAVYLGLRLALLGGPGGYADAEGRSLSLGFDPIFFLRNVGLQLPYRLLIPLKRAGDLLLPLAALSTVLALALASAARIWRRPRELAKACAAFVVALLPAASLFSIDVDHESSRMLYFPVAAFALAAAACLPAERSPRLRWAAVLLLAYWSPVTIANGRAWSEASGEIERTLALMRRVEDRYDPGTTVLIAGHDTWKGAYAWRNGLAFAGRLHGLRRDIHWALGTTALLPDPGRLGLDAFAIGFDAGGRAVDWTACEQVLRRPDVPVLARHSWPPAGDAAPARLYSPPLLLDRETAAPAARLRFAGCPEIASTGGPRTGRLYWRESSQPVRFNVTDARIFRLPTGPRGEVVVRLGPTRDALQRLELRVETARPAWLGCLREVEILEGPPNCGSDLSDVSDRSD